ncbi:unnamed protein product [Mycena citricolor]|uniref:Uncharacterized protein n=1 Tax=Mycena citricolor TaxID=2018698 RepID=A0AAD2Q1V7_9AGAR|nr:unnamed protein product [Mycena citricolor]
MEEEMVRDNNKQMMVALGLIGFGYAEAKRQKPNRLYMCWPQIPPNPCVNTPWKAMYVNGSDRAFITTMGIDTDMFSRERVIKHLPHLVYSRLSWSIRGVETPRIDLSTPRIDPGLFVVYSRP